MECFQTVKIKTIVDAGERQKETEKES